MTVRFIDLFAGIGGLRQGFDPHGECVFTSEWDRFAQQTYRANFGNYPVHGDIRAVSSQEIPPHDLLLAGFPCQPFSIAGVSKKASLGRAHGFADAAQGTLFFEVARIIAHHQPQAIVLENVKNLRSHDKGRTFSVITGLLEELGYHLSWRVLDARHWVPQHRERIFIAGWRDSPGPDLNAIPLPFGRPTLRDILLPEEQVPARYTLTPHLWEYLQQYAAKHREKGNGFGFGLAEPDGVARTLSARYYKDGSEILIGQGDERPPRRLTPRECARLMGFSDSFQIPVSDTQAYRQFGNSVVVPVARAVGETVAAWFAGGTVVPLTGKDSAA